MSSGWVILSGIAVAVIGLVSAVWVATLTRRASPYDSMVKRVSAQDDRIDELQEQVDNLRATVGQAQDEVRAARDEAHEARNAAEQSLEESIAWADHHMDVVGVVAALHHPWPQVPRALQHRLADADYPSVPIIPTDAVPDPADDGQDKDPTTTGDEAP